MIFSSSIVIAYNVQAKIRKNGMAWLGLWILAQFYVSKCFICFLLLALFHHQLALLQPECN